MKDTGQPRTIAGKYELQKMLGQGGMGEVWVARELATGELRALKLLKTAAAASKENRARFEREARIATTLVSPHIAQVTDSGIDEEGDPFMALELLHGEDLQKRIKTEKALGLPFVVRLAIQVGRALHIAHSAGLVHRDLKPANIFLHRQGEEEIVKVLDFGIAKAAPSDNTEYTAAGAMLGTASYMSPEQIRNAKTVDHRADLWAFAVVLFRALTGQLPFEQTGFDLFLALTQDPIPTPQKITSLAPDLPAPLNVFFERSFMRDMGQRYANASAMVVGFCRAAGVTVPADVLYAADAQMPSPSRISSTSFQAVQPSTPVPGSQLSRSGASFAAPPIPPSGQSPLSSPAHSAPPLSPAVAMHTPMPISSPVSSGHGPVHTPPPMSPRSGPDPGAGLSGTLMLDVAPSLGKTGEHAAESPRRPLPAAGMAYPTPAPDTQARPMLPPEAPPLDPDEPDNAATLFYQPGLKSLATAQALVDVKPPAGPPRPPGQDPTLPSSAGLGAKDSAGDPKSQSFEPSPSKVIFTMPLEQARAAAMNLPDPTRSTGSFAARPASEGWSGAQDALSNPGAPGVALAPAAPSRTWLWIVVGVVVALGAAAAVYFVLLA